MVQFTPPKNRKVDFGSYLGAVSQLARLCFASTYVGFGSYLGVAVSTGHATFPMSDQAIVVP